MLAVPVENLLDSDITPKIMDYIVEHHPLYAIIRFDHFLEQKHFNLLYLDYCDYLFYYTDYSFFDKSGLKKLYQNKKIRIPKDLISDAISKNLTETLSLIDQTDLSSDDIDFILKDINLACYDLLSYDILNEEQVERLFLNSPLMFANCRPDLMDQRRLDHTIAVETIPSGFEEKATEEQWRYILDQGKLQPYLDISYIPDSLIQDLIEIYPYCIEEIPHRLTEEHITWVAENHPDLLKEIFK